MCVASGLLVGRNHSFVIKPFDHLGHHGDLLLQLCQLFRLLLECCGEVCISIGWSWGVMKAQTGGATAQVPVGVTCVIPKEGALLWADLIEIPSDAPHPDNAHAFLDYLMEPKVIAEITNTVRAANGNAASLPLATEVLRSDPAIYIPEQVIERLSPEK